MLKQRHNKTDDNIKVEQKSLVVWKDIFANWSRRMDEAYDKDRNDATAWDEHPAEWMEPYNDIVFYAWVEYDAPNPGSSWEDYLTKAELVKK